MASRRRRGNNFTDTLNHFQSQNPKPVVENISENNLFEDKNITSNELTTENDIKDHSLMSQYNMKFDNLLYALDSKLNPTEAELTKQKIFKRLSEKYAASPHMFTEKLVTIIEESVINNTINANSNSLINFCKISEELNKMCNDIENESMPELLISTTVNVSPSNEMSKNVNSSNSIKRVKDSINLDSSKIKTPNLINQTKKVYRKTPKSVFKIPKFETYDVSNESNSVDSSFVNLEAQCERLFPNEKKHLVSVPPIKDNLLSMDRVFSICEKQMASLESSDDEIKIKKRSRSSIRKSKSKIMDSDSSKKDSILKNSVCNDNDKNRKVKEVSNKRRNNDSDSEYLNSTDDLSKTVLSEIVKKRRRCLDTARKMIEINSECNIIEKRKKSKTNNKSILNVDSNKSLDNSSQFMKMLMSCEDYHDYLNNQFTLLDASSINSTFNSILIKPDEKENNDIDVTLKKDNIDVDVTLKKDNIDVDVTKGKKNVSSRPSTSMSYDEIYEKVLARWNIQSNEKKLETEENDVNNKSHFFTTPGKLLKKDKLKQKMYFTDLNTVEKQQSSPLKTMTNNNNNSNYNNRLSPGFTCNKIKSRKSRRESLRKLSKLNSMFNKNKEKKLYFNI